MQQWLDALRVIAQEAGEKILEVYQSEFAITHKGDASPLTQADLAAHHHIVAALQALSPALPVLSEEDADIAHTIRRRWQRYWLVDPLDGTREFIKRNGEFTVNIALIDDGWPVLGVVHAPALGLTAAAAQGLGAWQFKQGRRQPLRTRAASLPPSLVVSKSHRDARLEDYLAQLPPHSAAGRGSSLKFLLVAEGTADLYPRTGPTSEWDTAAGQCVVEQAGGQVLALPGGQRLRYNQKDSLLNPAFVAIGDPAHSWARWLPPA